MYKGYKGFVAKQYLLWSTIYNHHRISNIKSCWWKMSSTNKRICFDRSKNEYFQLNTNYKLLHGKLKANWTVEQ